MNIQIGSIVRYSNDFCNRIQMIDADDTDTLARVVDIIPAKRLGGSTIPARARLHWETGERGTALVKNLELYRGVESTSAKIEWGMEVSK